MPKVGVSISTSTMEVATVIADLGTLSGAVYAPTDEILPSERADGADATRVERGAGSSLCEASGVDHFACSRELSCAVLDGRELLRALLQDHLRLRHHARGASG